MLARIILFFNLTVFCLANNYNDQLREPKMRADKWESYIFKDKEYIIQNLPLKWEDAKILCRGHLNGTLAIVDSLEKAEFLVEAITESQFELESLWVGARRFAEEDPVGYNWVETGVPLRRTPEDVVHIDVETRKKQFRHFPVWLNRTHVPVPEGGADCVALDRLNHDFPVFLDLSCQLGRPFVCERAAQSESSVSELRIVRCNSALYHVYNGRMAWDQAAAYCVLKKMTLANIASMRCMKKLGMTMLKMRPSIETAWIGARGHNGKWAWIDNGMSIFSITSLMDDFVGTWPPLGKSDNLRPNGCLQLDRHTSQPPTFVEARCERKLQFICYSGQLGPVDLVRTTLPPSDDTYFYVLERQALSWQAAYDNCLVMNGTLAKIDNHDIMIRLLLVMGENKEESVDHIWLSGRLNGTKDASGNMTYSWYNPATDVRIPGPNSEITGNTYMAPWLDDDFSMDSPCLNLDRQNHIEGMVYGMPCDTQQSSICLIEKGRLQPDAQDAPIFQADNTKPFMEARNIITIAEKTTPNSYSATPQTETLSPKKDTTSPDTVKPDIASTQQETLTETTNPQSMVTYPEFESENTEAITAKAEVITPEPIVSTPQPEVVNNPAEITNPVSIERNLQQAPIPQPDNMNRQQDPINPPSDTINPPSDMVNQQSDGKTPQADRDSDTDNTQSEIKKAQSILQNMTPQLQDMEPPENLEDARKVLRERN